MNPGIGRYQNAKIVLFIIDFIFYKANNRHVCKIKKHMS